MADNELGVRIFGIDDLSGELKKVESGVIRFVGAVSSALTALSVIGFPVLESARFQRELLEAAKTTDYTAEQIDVLRSGLVSMSRQIDVSATDLAKIATMGGQLGIGSGGNVSALVTFTEEIARAVTALDIPAEEAVASIGKLINIFNVPQDKFRNLISSLNAVSNASNATASELFDVVRRIGNLGGSVDIPQSAALAASMIDLGLTAETAGTTVTKIFADMKSEAAKFATFMDMSTEEWVRLVSVDGLQALDAFTKKLNSISVDKAAAAKVDLTGGGRIFEAVTKLQEQQLRAARLTAKANEVAAQAKDIERRAAEGVADADTAQLEAIRKREAALRAQAEQANVITRLYKEAKDGFDSGTSAMREQQVVLGGIQRQWDVLRNNISAAAMAVGDTLLPGLTEVMRELSGSIGSDLNLANLRRAAQEIITTFREIDQVVHGLFGGAGGTGVDWGAFLKVATLLATVALIRGLFSVVSTMLRTLLEGIGATGVATALFGVRKSVESTGAAATAAAAQTAAATTVFQTGFTNLTAGAVRVMETARAYNQLGIATTAAARGAAARDLGAARYDAILARLTAMRPRLTNIAQLEAEITALQARRAAATGRSAGGLTAQINLLTNIRAQLDAAAGAVGAAEQRTVMATQATERWRQAIASNSSGLVGFVTAVDTVVRNLNTRLGATVAQFGAARAAGISFSAAMAGALAAGRTATVQPLPASFRDNGQIDALRVRIRRLIAEMWGVGDAWARSTTVVSRGALIMAGSLNFVARATGLLATAAGKVLGVLMRFVNIAFFVMLAKDLLEMIGLWDKFAGAIETAAEKLGLARVLPDWLKPKNAAAFAEQVKEQERLREVQKEVVAEASKFTKATEANIEYLSDARNAAEAFAYSAAEPGRALDNATEALGDVTAAYSELQRLAIELTQANEHLVTQEKEREALLKRINAATNSPTLNAADAVRLDSLKKEVEVLDTAIARTKKNIISMETSVGALSGLSDAFENIATNVFTAGDASRLFTRSVDTGVAEIETYFNALADIAAKQKEVAKLQQDVLNRGTGTQEADASAQLERQRNKLQELELSLRESTSAADAMYKKMLEASKSPVELDRAIRKLASNENKQSLKALGGFLADLGAKGVKFNGSLLPKVKESDIFAAGVDVAFKTRAKQMFESFSQAAGDHAVRAKNYIISALGEMETRTKNLEKLFTDMAQAFTNAQQKASNQKADVGLDSALRKRLTEVEIAQDKEKAAIEDKYRIELQYLQEIDQITGTTSAETLRVLAEKKREEEALNEKYRQRRQLIEDANGVEKAKRNAGQDIAQLDDLIARARLYTTAMEDANSVMRAGNPDRAEAATAAARHEENLQKARAALEQINQQAVKLAGTDPIGGQLVVSPEQLARVKSSIEQLTKELNTAQEGGRTMLQPIYESMKTQADNVIRSLDTDITNSMQNLKKLSEESGRSWGETVRLIGTAVTSTSELSQAYERLGQMSKQGMVSLGTVKPEEVRKTIDEAKAAIENITSVKLPVDIDLKGDRIAASVTAALQSADAALTAFKAKAAEDVIPKVKPELAPGAAGELERQIESQVRPKIDMDVRANVRANYDARGGFVDGYRGYARGGLIEKAFAAIPKFASGGAPARYISGPGTGTSDSILSWLSNGEYVMDALTTSRFGPKFFAFLQSMARKGSSSTVLSMLSGFSVPKFASGGPVLPSMSALMGNFETDFKNGSQANAGYMQIDLTQGDKRATIHAERKEADALIRMLKGVARG